MGYKPICQYINNVIMIVFCLLAEKEDLGERKEGRKGRL